MPSLESGDHEKPSKEDESKEKQSTSETLEEFMRKILTEIIDCVVPEEEEEKMMTQSQSMSMADVKSGEPRCSFVIHAAKVDSASEGNSLEMCDSEKESASTTEVTSATETEDYLRGFLPKGVISPTRPVMIVVNYIHNNGNLTLIQKGPQANKDVFKCDAATQTS